MRLTNQQEFIMSFNLTTGSVFIKPNMGESADAVLRRTPLLDYFIQSGMVESSEGSAPFNWPVYISANSSAGSHTEGETFSSFGAQGTVQASLPVAAFKATAELSGHQRANALKNGLYNNAWGEELTKAEKDMLKAAEDAFCGSSTNVGLQSMVAANGTYAGIDSSTVSVWKSTVVSSIGTGSFESFCKAEAALSPYVSYADMVVFGSPTALRLLQKDAEASGSIARQTPIGGGPVDYGRFPGSMQISGHDCIPVFSLPDTELYILDKSDARLIMHQELDVRPLGPVNNDDRVLMTIYMILKLKTRNKHAKITGIS